MAEATDTGTANPDPNATKRDELKAKLSEGFEAVKAEVAQRLDQLLDELGALI